MWLTLNAWVGIKTAAQSDTPLVWMLRSLMLFFFFCLTFETWMYFLSKARYLKSPDYTHRRICCSYAFKENFDPSPAGAGDWTMNRWIITTSDIFTNPMCCSLTPKQWNICCSKGGLPSVSTPLIQKSQQSKSFSAGTKAGLYDSQETTNPFLSTLSKKVPVDSLESALWSLKVNKWHENIYKCSLNTRKQTGKEDFGADFRIVFVLSDSAPWTESLKTNWNSRG